MTQVRLSTEVGDWILAGKLMGHKTVGSLEMDLAA